MTFGDQPYPNILYPSDDLYDYLRDGNRMEKPLRCPITMQVSFLSLKFCGFVVRVVISFFFVH